MDGSARPMEGPVSNTVRNTDEESKDVPSATSSVEDGASEHPALLTVTSHFVTAKTLFRIRFSLSTFMIGFLVFHVWYVVSVQQPARVYFIFFTYLNFLSEACFCFVTTYHSYNYVYDGRARGRPPPLFVRFPILLKFHNWLYVTVAVNHVIVPVVFWALLASPTLFAGPTADIVNNFGVHLSDFLVMAVQVVFSRNPIRVKDVLVVVVVVGLYTALAILNFNVNHFWVYPFLNYNAPVWYAWYIGVLLFFVIVFFLQYGFHRLRDKFGPRFSRHGAIRPASPMEMV